MKIYQVVICSFTSIYVLTYYVKIWKFLLLLTSTDVINLQVTLSVCYLCMLRELTYYSMDYGNILRPWDIEYHSFHQRTHLTLFQLQRHAKGLNRNCLLHLFISFPRSNSTPSAKCSVSSVSQPRAAPAHPPRSGAAGLGAVDIILLVYFAITGTNRCNT